MSSSFSEVLANVCSFSISEVSRDSCVSLSLMVTKKEKNFKAYTTLPPYFANREGLHAFLLVANSGDHGMTTKCTTQAENILK